MNADLDLLLYFASLSIALLWFALLIGKTDQNPLARRILAVLLVTISLSIGNTLLRKTGYLLTFPHLIGLTWPLAFAYPPLFYLYVKSLISQPLRPKREILHFLPFAVFTAYMLPFYFQSGPDKIDLFTGTVPDPAPGQRLIPILVLASEALYICLSWVVLSRHRRYLRGNYSSLEAYNLNWIRNLIVTYTIVTLVFLVSQYPIPVLSSFNISPPAVFGLTFVLGYLGLRQPSYRQNPDESTTKYKKSGLTDQLAKTYNERLDAFMKTHKPFYDSDLTLQKLADHLSIPANHLSQLLNEKLEQNFFDYVNGFRVREVQEMLMDPAKDHLTLLAIAYDAGFSSKSSFNLIFKRHTKMTPSQFKRSLNA